MNAEKADVWQGLMDKAYDRWNKGDLKDAKYEEFLFELDGKQGAAVLLGNFNYQVENGGLVQWVDNGYACHAKDLLLAMRNLNGPAAVKVNGIVKKVSRMLNPEAKSRGCFGGNYWKEPAHEDEEDDRWDLLEKLTDEYYAVADAFKEEVEAFLAKEQ